jgi:hypothetical protein
MTPDLSPVRLLLLTLTGWVNRQQQEVIEYLVEENRVLVEQLRGRRLRLTDDQRRRLAARGQRLGRRILSRVATIVTPDTILRWHRLLIEVELRAEAAGASRHSEGDRGTYRADGHGQPGVGLQSDPGRVEESRPSRREKHGLQGAEGQRDPTSAGAVLVVAHVPAGALGRDRGGRLLHD